MTRPGLLLYFDVLPALDKLPHAAVGELLLAALHYAQDGIDPTFEESSLAFAWAFLRPSIDRDGATYEAKRLKGEWLAYCKQCKRDDVQSLDFDTWREHIDNGTLTACNVPLQTPTAPKPTTSPTPSPTTSPTPAPAQEQLQPNYTAGEAASPPAPARDSRNLVFLDDGQYSALLTDLGEHEVQRCISYLSEYCSMHNRQYKDWDAAIRKASREGWGLSSPKSGSKDDADFQPSAERIQKNNDWLDAFLAEQEGKGGGSDGG